ncbi:MAG: hypothetical protein K2P49_02485 [Oscillospiraceae bacterium]|nr:hypothetical protein [Oscillospiraceae bacterium]
MKKQYLFRGLAAVCGLACAVSSFITPVAYANAGGINSFLNITAPGAGSSASADTMYFKTEFTEDGTLSEAGQTALLAAEDTYNIRAMEEGAVLVRNEGSALPLSRVSA